MKKNSPFPLPKTQRKKVAACSQPKRVSSRDVARQAGVSQTTVSFVLSGREDVSIPEETRQRVFAAAAQLGYLRSHLASGLLRGRTQSVGVVLLSTVYPWMIFTGIQAGLAQADYVPVLLSSVGVRSTPEAAKPPPDTPRTRWPLSTA